MKKDIQEQLVPVFQEVLKDLELPKLSEAELSAGISLAGNFGDLSSNLALKLSKVKKQSPLKLAADFAEKISSRLEGSGLRKYISQVKAEGAGFVNFYFSEAFFHEKLKDIVTTGADFAKIDLGHGKKVLFEFVSANPTGALSVAHARQAAVGDALANIFKFLGFDVTKEYYLNDEGNQINILGRSVEARLKELNGEKIEFPENYYQGEYIYDLAREIKDKGLKINDFGEYAGDKILAVIKQELTDFGVNFDSWYSQKELNKSGKIKKTLDDLTAAGFLYQEEGALWLKSTQFGDDKDRVVIKSDGTYTYLAPDIAYHKDKYLRGFQWCINFWGPDHHGYISRLKASVQAVGYDPQSLSVIIVQLATIFREGKIIEMSTRKGQYITLREVLDEVGTDAARFFFMMRRTSSHLNFDLEVAKKQTAENPVYYVQYAHARIFSILRQGELDLGRADDVSWSLLKEKEEIDLIRKLWQFPYMLDVCLKTLDSYMLTVYLQEVAMAFHRFYDLHRVLGQDAQLTKARLELILAAKIVLQKGLELLGISAPEKM